MSNKMPHGKCRARHAPGRRQQERVQADRRPGGEHTESSRQAAAVVVRDVVTVQQFAIPPHIRDDSRIAFLSRRSR